MPYSFLQLAANVVCISLVIRSCFSVSIAKHVLLRPITISDHDTSFDLRPRDLNPYSRLDLQPHGQLAYGSPAGSVVQFERCVKK